jgi:ribosomal protein S18 acetylase RimI-like enzyme
VRVREASARDALEIVELRRRVVAEDRWFISEAGELDLEVEETLRVIALLKGSSSGTLRVARLDGRVVGFLSLRPPPFRRMRHVVKLEIAVAHGHRGEGIGRRLMEAALGWARATPGIDKVGLAVFADNERALALYRAFGFVEEGRRLREYKMADGSWRDDLLLALDVRSD